MPQILSNNGSTTTDLLLTAIQTQVRVVSVTGFPTQGELAGVDDYAVVTIEDVSGNFEIVHVTSLDPGTLIMQITRAQEGTVALEFPVGSRVELRLTAGFFDQVLLRDGDTIHGGTTGSETPVASEDVVVLKHTRQADLPAVPTLETGELALHARARLIYAGMVDSAGNPEDGVLYPGLWVQSSTPDITRTVDGTLWLDTTANLLVLKIWQSAAWHTVFGEGRIGATLALLNNIALRGRNLANDGDFNLASVNASDQIVLGDASALITYLLGAVAQMGPTIRLVPTAVPAEYWELKTEEVGSKPYISLQPRNSAEGYDSTLMLGVRAVGGTLRELIMSPDGTVSLPAGIDPVDPDDIAPKRYVDAQIAAAASGPVAMGRVTSGGAEVGEGGTYTVSGSGGSYTITLATAVSDTNNGIFIGTANDTSDAEDYGITVAGRFTSTTTIAVRVRRVGSDAALEGSAFSFVVYDSGA